MYLCEYNFVQLHTLSDRKISITLCAVFGLVVSPWLRSKARLIMAQIESDHSDAPESKASDGTVEHDSKNSEYEFQSQYGFPTFSSNVFMGRNSGHFLWEIDDEKLVTEIVNADNEQKFESPEFTIANLRWKMDVYPNGKDEESKGYVNVDLRLMELPHGVRVNEMPTNLSRHVL